MENEERDGMAVSLASEKLCLSDIDSFSLSQQSALRTAPLASVGLYAVANADDEYFELTPPDGH